jgi:hypothetical protein
MTQDTDPRQRASEAVPLRGVLLVVGVIALFLIGSVAGLALLFPDSTRVSPPQPTVFPGIDLETRPVADFVAWRTEQAALLGGAGGRLPISEAMAQIAARGAAAFDPLEAPR